ncbi:hypothetical protein EG68_03695 [Paragonimus skrjabini miyazakii]|uniref:Fibronectin type-III domain-containing protein n=1 Tax=Paragonimus skrjabini miyazakii TaxID=59628 RepID=A0A8S9Z0R5_9TREM|nr:hypothetical protein EG68_03695 [Paragonimus skrjabini miyazakii]
MQPLVKALQINWNISLSLKQTVVLYTLQLTHDQWSSTQQELPTVNQTTLTDLQPCKFYCVKLFAVLKSGESHFIGQDCTAPLSDKLGVVRNLKLFSLSTGTDQMISWKRPKGAVKYCSFYYVVEQKTKNGGSNRWIFNSEGPHLIKSLLPNTLYVYTVRVHLGSSAAARTVARTKVTDFGKFWK